MNIKKLEEQAFASGQREYGLKKFAELVAAYEREECAKLCDDMDDDVVDGYAGWQYGEAIRARGKA